MTFAEVLGLLLAFIGLAFAFEAPRAWFLRVLRIRGTAASPAQDTPPPSPNPPSEKDKLVTSAWWEASDLRKEYENQGFSKFRWSNADRVAEREQHGYKVVFLCEAGTNTHYRIVNKSSQVLMAKP